MGPAGASRRRCPERRARLPRGAYLWLLLGKTLKQSPQFAAPGEIESCLRRSLQLNQTLFESADWLVVVLAEQNRYDEAARVLTAIEPRLPDPGPALGRLAWIKRQSGAKREALTELAALLRDSPWYTWGWNLLLAWLEEDRDWELTNELLHSIPPHMLTDVSIRQRRVQLLEKANTASSATDAEWQNLLADYPENVPLHLLRYDSLRNANRWAESSEVLQSIAPVAPADSFLLARLVEMECHDKKFPEALRHALEISFSAPERNPWPVDRAWDLLGEAGLEDQLLKQFQSRLCEGAKPARRSLSRSAEKILGHQASGGGPRWFRESLLNHAARRIRALTRTIEQSTWRDASCFADLFAALNHNRYEGLVLSSWKRMQRAGFQTDTDVWAQVGCAMINLGRKRDARRLMHDWRQRAGVTMWAVANYQLCVPRLSRGNLYEVIGACRDALAGLRHDHCARYLAFMLAEACALAGDTSALLDTWKKYSAYLDRPLEKTDFFPKTQEYLLGELPLLVESLELNDLRACKRTFWKLRLRRFWTQELRTFRRQALRWLRYLIPLLWLLAALAPMIFR